MLINTLLYSLCVISAACMQLTVLCSNDPMLQCKSMEEIAKNHKDKIKTTVYRVIFEVLNFHVLSKLNFRGNLFS